MDCPLGFKEKEWCLDCMFAKEAQTYSPPSCCDWPFKMMGGDARDDIVGDENDDRGETAAA